MTGRTGLYQQRLQPFPASTFWSQSPTHHLQWGEQAGLNKGQPAGLSFPMPLLELEGSQGS